MKLAGLHFKNRTEPVWHVQIAVLCAIALQLLVSNDLVVWPKYATAGLEVVLLFALWIIRPGERSVRFHLRRIIAVLLIALVSIANIAALVFVINALFNGAVINGHELIISALAIYLTNIIIFGLWYWELDNVQASERDFLFPQMATSEKVTGQTNWQPTFFDYLYISVTNASAFSPTDTLPLTKRIKLLMTLQSLTSLATVALVAARAVNILV